MTTPRRPPGPLLAAGALSFALACASSVERIAVDRMADALAGSTAVFASDDDPELVAQALPFSLKLMESLLARTPDHEELLVACAGAFTQYAYAFVQLEAEEREEHSFDEAQAMRDRARRLYLRARGYGLRALELRQEGFEAALRADPPAALARLSPGDVPALFWTAAAWAGAIALSKDDPMLIADLPLVEALVDRALALDEGFDGGAIHAFLIAFEPARATAPGDALERSRRHFERAVALSAGGAAGAYVSLAETAAVRRRDLAEFQDLLGRALAIDPDRAPQRRLATLIAQRRARWLLARADELFLLPPAEESPAANDPSPKGSPDPAP